MKINFVTKTEKLIVTMPHFIETFIYNIIVTLVPSAAWLSAPKRHRRAHKASDVEEVRDPLKSASRWRHRATPRRRASEHTPPTRHPLGP